MTGLNREMSRWAGSILVALLLLAATSAATFAKYASIIVDADTGAVLHASNADTRNFPASLTKMMTLYMLFDALERGELKLDSKLKVSQRAAGMAPSKLGLKAGSTITVEDAILATVTKSANDVATVIAENLGGSESKFARNMTDKAAEIGMRRSTFRNASGLPNRAQMSTARDMAILAKRLMIDFPQFYHYFAREQFTYSGRVMKTHNNLLGTFEGADGIKTGYTVASGFNLVSSARRDGHRLIGVVFGGKSARSRDAHMVNLLDAGFAKVSGGQEVLIAAPKLEDFDFSSPMPTLDSGGTVAVGDTDNDDADVLTGFAPPEKPDPARGWGIQVGAYGERDRATTNAVLAAQRVKSQFPDAYIRVEPINWKKGRVLYRAQVVGFDQSETTKACALAAIKTRVPCQAVPPAKARKTARR